MKKINRRDILKASALFAGYTLAGGTVVSVMNGCTADKSDGWRPSFFTQEEVDTIAEVAERIIPTTDTPGAKDALVHRYIDEAVANNFNAEEQAMAKEMVKTFDAMAKSEHGKPFVKLSEAEMDGILQELADRAKAASADDERMFFDMRGMVAAGYFTSEIGATQALIHDPVPGPYQGCIPFTDVGGTYAL